jgi:hypothetical protein
VSGCSTEEGALIRLRGAYGRGFKGTVDIDGLEDVDVDAAGRAGLAVGLFLVLWCVFMFDALDADNAGVDVCAAEAEGGKAARRAGGNSKISSSSSSSRSRLRSRIGTMAGGAARDDEDANEASDLGSS